ncbi:MAG: sulfurtransferase [Gemmatimonadales bacterium]
MRVAWCMALLPAILDAQSPRLIATGELAGWLARDTIPMVVVDVRQSWTSYLQNHLPKAVWLNIETLRAQAGDLPFQLLPAAHYAELFHRLRLTPERRVVVYSAGDQSNIDATFVAWLLASAGATQVMVLDGGYAKWELEGRPLTQRYPHDGLQGGGFQPERFRPSLASLADVRAAVAGSGTLLVDARPPEQFHGSAGAQTRRGHIPGALSHPWKDDLEKPGLALVWKSPETLRASYTAQGITPDRDIILYCNSGTEASHVFFALRYLLGYPRARIYSGAWTEWAEREDLPVAR